MSKTGKVENLLITKRPDLLSEWNYERNGDIDPNILTTGSHKRVWWICSEGHEWESIISNRARLGRNCPYCSNQKKTIGVTDLASTHPLLVTEWDYEKNTNVTPQEVSSGSKKIVWWKCTKGHSWKAEIKSRSNGIGCPICSNKQVLPEFNDLATINPRLAKEWNYEKNDGLKPSDVTYGSGKIVWWKCKNGHDYKKRIDARRKGQGCPICSRRRRTSSREQTIFYYVKKVYPDAINTYKDIFTGSMELDIYIPSIQVGIEYDGRQYHTKQKETTDQRKYHVCQENNITLIRFSESPKGYDESYADIEYDVLDGSIKHLEASLSKLFKYLNKSVDIDIIRDRLEILEYLEALDISLLSENPAIAAEWDYEKNSGLRPEHFHNGSNERVWWLCKQCNHSWKASIAERTKNKTGCPKCSVQIRAEKNHKTVLAKQGSIDKTHPILMLRWDSKKNKISPTEVTHGNGEKHWWKCNICGYSWESTINHILRSKNPCPFCNGKIVIKGDNDLATTNPELLDEWDYEKNSISPSEVKIGSGKKVWWKCTLGHSWETRLVDRKKGGKCPYCNNRKILPGFNDLATIRPDIAKEWHPYRNTDISLSSVGIGSKKNAWWICDQGHEWVAQISNRCHQGSGCPICSKSQKKK